MGARIILVLLFLVCTRANAATPLPSDLAGTSWQLVKIQSGDQAVTPEDKSKYTIAFGKDGYVSARIDCNRGHGTWKSSGANQIEFGPLALTRAMCPPGSLHDRIAGDWNLLQSYSIRDGHLSLILEGGAYEFEPISQAQSSAPKSPVELKGPIVYDCTQATGSSDTLRATFYETTPQLVLLEYGNKIQPAFQVASGSGARYEGEGILFWDKGGEALMEWSGVQLECKAQ